jgi:hypothetical protein
MSKDRAYTERMSRILADAQPAPPRVGCVLLRSRLGARGRDSSNLALFNASDRKALLEELGVIAGGVDADTSPAPVTELEVFFVDPSSKTEQYGGPDGWARCVKGYLNARGYSASIAVAPSREAALAAARSRWGIVVIHDQAVREAPSHAVSVHDRDPRVQTGVGLKAPVIHTAHAAHMPQPRMPGQLGLPGLVLGRPKRQPRARTSPARPHRKAS